MEQWLLRLIIYAKNHARKTHVTELNGESQAVGRTAMRANDPEVIHGERVLLD